MPQMDDAKGEQLTAAINSGIVKARTIVNYVNRRDERGAEEAVRSFLADFWRELSEEEQGNVALNALTMMVQVQDQLENIRRELGVRKVK
jgi:hypothetical protein